MSVVRDKKIRIAVSDFLTSWIKNFLFPELKYGSRRCFSPGSFAVLTVQPKCNITQFQSGAPIRIELRSSLEGVFCPLNYRGMLSKYYVVL